MFHSAGKTGFVTVQSLSLSACVSGCVSVHYVLNNHPSFSSVAVRGRAIKLHCFYSISRHYQRQFDYWVHLAGGEQRRRQAAFSFVPPPMPSSSLARVTCWWGVRSRQRGRYDARFFCTSQRPQSDQKKQTTRMGSRETVCSLKTNNLCWWLLIVNHQTIRLNPQDWHEELWLARVTRIHNWFMERRILNIGKLSTPVQLKNVELCFK